MNHLVSFFETSAIVNVAFPDHSMKSSCLEQVVSVDQLLP